jgi:hypothetical protein
MARDWREVKAAVEREREASDDAVAVRREYLASLRSMSDPYAPKGGDEGSVFEAADVFGLAVAEVFDDLKALLLKKHADYGPKNISQSPGGPLNGLRVRMWDKMARINNLTETGAEPENESLVDSYRDLANYSVIALLVLQGDWPES